MHLFSNILNPARKASPRSHPPAIRPTDRRLPRWALSQPALFLLPFFLLIPSAALAATDIVMPELQLSLSGGATEPEKVALTLEILFLLTVLSLAPAIMLTVTSFTRIIIVLHFLRQAMGIQQIPPSQILASLAIFMTVVIMFPVGRQINDTALQPYLDERLGFNDALSVAQEPLRTFMFKHTREKDLSIFYSIARMERPNTKDDVPTIILAAAYVISELKTGFTIGFLIYIPFLVLDMVVSSILLAMGMMMLPPMMVSMPFKLLLFVMVDGWNLVVGSLVNSFLGA
jgi:flagellar biosynthetic protein FliP